MLARAHTYLLVHIHMHANLSLKMCELLKCLHTSVTVFAQVQSQHAFGVTTETKVFGARTQYNFTPFFYSFLRKP